jgi:hypothetical protein
VKRDYGCEELGDFRSISGKDTDSKLGKDLQNFLHHVNRAPKDWGGSVPLDVILVGLMSPLCPAVQCLPTPIPLAMGGYINSPKENCFQKL